MKGFRKDRATSIKSLKAQSNKDIMRTSKQSYCYKVDKLFTLDRGAGILKSQIFTKTTHNVQIITQSNREFIFLMTTKNWKTAECLVRVLLATWDAMLNEIEAKPQSTKEQIRERFRSKFFWKHSCSIIC